MSELIQQAGLIAAVILPFWNIPLILRIQERSSSEDISLWWVVGVWICMVVMLPSALISGDFVYKIFGIMNLFFFSAVLVQVFRFKKFRRDDADPPAHTLKEDA